MTGLLKNTLLAGTTALTVAAGIAAVPTQADAFGRGFGHFGGYHGFYGGRRFGYGGFGYRRFGYGYGYRRFGYGLGGGLLLGALAGSYYGGCGPYGYGYGYYGGCGGYGYGYPYGGYGFYGY